MMRGVLGQSNVRVYLCLDTKDVLEPLLDILDKIQRCLVIFYQPLECVPVR